MGDIAVAWHRALDAVIQAHSAPGVVLGIADRGTDGCAELGGGWASIGRELLGGPRPTVVLGLQLPTSDLAAKLLSLPFVRFLEVPFTAEQFQSAAQAARAASIVGSDVEAQRREWSEALLAALQSDVIHVLRGGVVGFMASLQCDLEAGGMDVGEDWRSNWHEKREGLAYYTARLRQMQALLGVRIDELDGIAPATVPPLRDAANQLVLAARSLDELQSALDRWGSDAWALPAPVELKRQTTQFRAAVERAYAILNKAS